MMSPIKTYHRNKMRETFQKWKGLRHIHRQAVEGKGIDCIRLVLECFFDAELLERAPLPNAPNTWGMMAPKNILAVIFERCTFSIRIPIKDWRPQFGDVLIWKVGRQSNHCGIVGDNDQVWHVITGGVVNPGPLKAIRPQLQEVVRVIEKGWKKKPAELNLKALLSEL